MTEERIHPFTADTARKLCETSIVNRNAEIVSYVFEQIQKVAREGFTNTAITLSRYQTTDIESVKRFIGTVLTSKGYGYNFVETDKHVVVINIFW